MAGHNLTFDHVKDQFVLRLPAGDPLVFTHRHDHVYTCRVKDKEHFRRLSIVPASNRTPCSALLTATEHDQEFTKREIDKAREAQDLVRKLAYPSTSALLHAMRSGALIGTSVTARDVDRALILWGPDVAALKGRTTGHRSPKIPEVRRRLARQQQSLHCDVMFIERQPFLLAVAKPSQYVYVTPMRNKTAADIGRALRAQIAHASAHNVLINEIRSDPESGLVAVAEELMRAGILPEITAATEAVPAAERAIRLVKERVRCVVNGLPFRLPLGLLAAAVQYCVQRLNMLPSTVSQSPGASARELFTGLKTDASRDLRLKFGEYVQVHTAKTCNSLKPRTEGCIALYGSDNLSGSWHMFGLKTGRTTVRQRWTQLPTPAEVIERMNDLAHGGVVLLDAAHSERGLDETVDAAEPVQEASASTVPTNYEDDYEVAGTTYEPDELPATYLSSEDADLPDKHESAREDDQLAAASEQARLPSIRDATNTSPSPSPRMLQHQQSPKLASDDAEALHGNPVHEHDDLEPTGNPGVPGAAENPGVLGPAENPGVHKSAENLGGHETAEELGAHESAEGSGPQHPIGDYWPSPSPASESVRFKEQAIEIKPDRKRKAPTNGEQQEACEPPEDLLKRSHSIIMELKRTAGAMPQRGKRARKPSTRTSMSKRKATGVVEPDEISKRARAFLTTLKHASVMHLSAKAACRQYGAGALQAVVAEVAQMLPRHGKDVLHPVALRDMSWAQRRMIIPSHLFVKAQTWANGDLKKIKARLVAGGNLQDKSLYPDASSPTASTNALFLIAALAAQENRAVASIDFPGAFLNAQMPDNPPTYIRLNRFLANTLVAIEPRYQAQQNVDGTMICRLNKALYGTILASKLWYEKLTGLLVKLRFVPNPYDACVWNREQHGRQVTVVLHVDDVFVSAPSESDIDGLIREIEHEYDGVERHRGKVLSYVGMVFDFNTPGIVSVSMPGYVETVLKDSAVSGRSSSPAGTNLFAVSNKVERLSGPRADRFHSLVCKLLYMAKRARPDLLTAVSF